ncbi:MAG: NAD(P)/FAD-dependent oxidoreductase [Planctomycetes bacterium]|nr:NAD(P)/FAD-dependent oxidoreductase [Planctomycetota bacterium]
MRNEVADVLVIGAGPAGSALALQLAQAGFTVTMVDRREFPRHKPCGEFLSPQCVPYLQQLGLGGMLDELGAHHVEGMQLSGYGASTGGRFRQLPDRAAIGRHGFGIRREVFDHRLVQAAIAAGVEFLPRHDFVELTRTDAVVDGARFRDAQGQPVARRARQVVGADGVHSRVAKALGVQRRLDWLDQFALVAHFEGVAPGPVADVQLLPGGFFAATTVDQGLYSLNLVLPRRALRERTAADWDQFVQQHAAGSPAIAARLQGARRLQPWRGIGPFGFRTTTATVPGCALVGDAAGYVDPMTGEGIYFALFGARALGDAITAALHEPGTAPAAMARYRRARARELGPRLQASKLLQRAIRHPWLVRTFLRSLQRWPRWTDLLVTLTGDTIHPRELVKPSFWRAWREAS